MASCWGSSHATDDLHQFIEKRRGMGSWRELCPLCLGPRASWNVWCSARWQRFAPLCSEGCGYGRRAVATALRGRILSGTLVLLPLLSPHLAILHRLSFRGTSNKRPTIYYDRHFFVRFADSFKFSCTRVRQVDCILHVWLGAPFLGWPYGLDCFSLQH